MMASLSSEPELTPAPVPVRHWHITSLFPGWACPAVLGIKEACEDWAQLLSAGF
jgi:hypothetical protein